MKFELSIGKGKISVENEELHEILIDTWAKQLIHAWKAMANATPLNGTQKFVMAQRLAYYPTYDKPSKADKQAVKTYITQKLSPFEQDWNDRKAIAKAIRERWKE